MILLNTAALKTFAPAVRRQLMEAVTRKLDFALSAKTPDFFAILENQKLPPLPVVVRRRKACRLDRAKPREGRQIELRTPGIEKLRDQQHISHGWRRAEGERSG